MVIICFFKLVLKVLLQKKYYYSIFQQEGKPKSLNDVILTKIYHFVSKKTPEYKNENYSKI